VSFLIDHGVLLSPADTILFSWWTEQTLDYMKRRNAIDSSMIERQRTLQRCADRILEMSQQGHATQADHAGKVSQLGQSLASELPDDQPSAQKSIGLPYSICTAQEVADYLGLSPKTVHRIKTQLGWLRDKPLMLSREGVIRFKIIRDS
jgi:hypothetical protein